MQAKRKRVRGLKSYQELPWIALFKDGTHYYNSMDEEISPQEYLKYLESCNTVVIELAPKEPVSVGDE